MKVDCGQIIEKVFDNCKKLTPALFAVALVSGGVLFLPVSLLKTLGLNNIPNIIRTIIGIVFLISVVLILTNIVWYYGQKIRNKRKMCKLVKTMRTKFQKLPQDLRDILIELMESPDRVIELDSVSGNTIYLVENYYIYKSEQICIPCYDDSFVFKYAPQPWLIDYYNEHPELFKR